MKKKKRKTIVLTAVFFLVGVLVCLGFVPLFQNLNYGLDLQGGFEVLYKVSTVDGSKMNSEKMTSTYRVLTKRIDSLGVAEPEVSVEGNNMIRIKLPGVTNEEEARRQLSKTASLSFRDTSDNLLMTSDVLNPAGAKLSVDNAGNPAVALSIKDKDTFYDVTNRVKDYTNNQIVIWLDFDETMDSYQSEKEQCGSLSTSRCLSAATVSQAFASDVIIQGNFTKEEAESLVDSINDGQLPTKMEEVSNRSVGASFGQDTLSNTLLAGIIGVVAIVIVMIVLYHFAGFLSAIAMLIYSFLVFLVFWIAGGVLTLPGIAAIVLGIGMAVDANVLTFSRIKDELYMGKSLKEAYRAGVKNSFSAILDSNLTTLLVALILFLFGESSVKGFATMLIITVLVTMFTMVFLTRSIMKVFIKTGYFDDKISLFIRVKKDKIPNIRKNETRKFYPFAKSNFIKYMKPCSIVSSLIIVLGLILVGTKGLNLGIDYRGGTDITIKTEEVLKEKELEKDLQELNLEKLELIVTEDEAHLKVSDVIKGDDTDKVTEYFENKYEAKVDIGAVSNLVKKELTKNAFYSVLFAILGMIIYISLRFKFSYAVSSVVALLHDVLMIVAIFALCQLEVSVMFIAAVLAIIGYSINNTIVTFDRIREELGKRNQEKMTKEELKEVVNLAIRETMSRSLFTSITTLLPVIALIFLGSSAILNFNLAMLIGLVAGTYSSLFISPNLFLYLEGKRLKKGKRPSKKKKKRIIIEDELEERQVKGVNS